MRRDIAWRSLGGDGETLTKRVDKRSAAALPVAIVNPRQVRDFANAVGQVAKTAALDAHLLARFAEVI